MIRRGAKTAGATQTCTSCNGQGVKITRRQIGPGMIQQMQQVCPECEGKGIVIIFALPKFH